MQRHPRYAVDSYSFGPGPATPAVKFLIWTNVILFVLTWLFPSLTIALGLVPDAVMQRLWLWQLVSYMFVHGSVTHILFNMLGVWMFGVELERMWGTRFFLRYYFVAGLGAAATTLLWSLLPFDTSTQMYYAVTFGASGALYGLLGTFALYFPDRPILMLLLFPIPAKYFVLIIGAIAFMASAGSGGGGVAHTAHLGGLVVGYLYLKGSRGIVSDVKSKYLRWKMQRLRKRFDVYSGGRRRDSWRDRVH